MSTARQLGRIDSPRGAPLRVIQSGPKLLRSRFRKQRQQNEDGVVGLVAPGRCGRKGGGVWKSCFWRRIFAFEVEMAASCRGCLLPQPGSTLACFDGSHTLLDFQQAHPCSYFPQLLLCHPDPPQPTSLHLQACCFRGREHCLQSASMALCLFASYTAQVLFICQTIIGGKSYNCCSKTPSHFRYAEL